MKTLVAFIALASSFLVSAQFELRQVIAPEIYTSYFANYVAIDGNTLVTANYRNDVLYVYEKVNGVWEFLQEIKPNDFTGDKYFGYRFSISGSTIMVGASNDDDDLGAVYFFERNLVGTWEQKTKIISPVPSTGGSDAYWGGRYININGDLAVATRNNGLNSAFQVLGRNQDNTWSLIDTLDIGSGWHGGTVAHVSDSLIIAPTHSWRPKELNVFKRLPNGEWDAPIKVTPTVTGQADYFAINIAVSGKTMIVGSPKEDRIVGLDTLKEAGKVYLFEEINGNWINTGEFYSSDSKAGDQFGYNVAIENDVFVAGSSYQDYSATNEDSLSGAGAVYVFKKESSVWNETQKLTSFNRVKNAYFGRHLAISNGNIVIGASGELFVFNEGIDCMGLDNGKAFYDVCTICVNGTSGNEPNLSNTNCVITELEEKNNVNKVSVYPNPFTDQITLSENKSWELLNAQGTILAIGERRLIDTQQLTSGTYFVKVDGEVVKLVK